MGSMGFSLLPRGNRLRTVASEGDLANSFVSTKRRVKGASDGSPVNPGLSSGGKKSFGGSVAGNLMALGAVDEEEVGPPPRKFCSCVVGEKPSEAKFFLADVDEVSELLLNLKRQHHISPTSAGGSVAPEAAHLTSVRQLRALDGMAKDLGIDLQLTGNVATTPNDISASNSPGRPPHREVEVVDMEFSISAGDSGTPVNPSEEGNGRSHPSGLRRCK